MSLAEELEDIGSVFIDTAPVIYYIEAHPQFGPIAKAIIDAAISGKITAYSSVITLAEVLPKPVEEKKERLAKKFSEFLKDESVFSLLDITPQTAERAGWLRGKYPVLRALDALQLASAIEAGADVFITNDKKLQRFSEIKTLLLSDYAGGVR